MNYEALFPSRFLKAADLQGKEHTVKISSLKIEKMPDGKTKGIVMFEGTNKEWLLNRTNAEHMKVMFGAETNDWVGKRVTLFTRVVEAFGTDQPAVRVKGSPDISEPMSAVITRGSGQRQKTIRVEVVPTGPAAKANGVKANGVKKPAPAQAAEADEGVFGEPGMAG